MGEAKRKGRSEEVVPTRSNGWLVVLVFDAPLQLSETGGDLISPCMYSYGDARESEAWSFGLYMDKGEGFWIRLKRDSTSACLCL